MIAKQRQSQEKKIRLMTTREETSTLTEFTIWYHTGITNERRFGSARHDWGKLKLTPFILHIYYLVSAVHNVYTDMFLSQTLAS
jgi:hypothetical protein